MFKKITVTEDNFLSILERMQKVCNKYRMLEFYRVFDENMKEKKQFRSNAIGIREGITVIRDSEGNYKSKKTKKMYYANQFLLVNKHSFRNAFEQEQESYESKLYSKMNTLIHLDYGNGRVLVLHLGDKIEFLPFGGFIIWDSNERYNFDTAPISIYKYIFIPDYIKGKISNLEEEITKRYKEWEEESKIFNEEYEEEYFKGENI